MRPEREKGLVEDDFHNAGRFRGEQGSAGTLRVVFNVEEKNIWRAGAEKRSLKQNSEL
jgi:hypothetical protein